MKMVNTDMKQFINEVESTKNPSFKDVKALENTFTQICKKYEKQAEFEMEQCFSSEGFVDCCVPKNDGLYDVLGPGTRREETPTFYVPDKPSWEYFVMTKNS